MVPAVDDSHISKYAHKNMVNDAAHASALSIHPYIHRHTCEHNGKVESKILIYEHAVEMLVPSSFLETFRKHIEYVKRLILFR